MSCSVTLLQPGYPCVCRVRQWSTPFPDISIVAFSLAIVLTATHVSESAEKPATSITLRVDQGQRVGFNPHRGGLKTP
jgi:hypothetical protein